MLRQVKITPKFMAHEVFMGTIGYNLAIFQNEALMMGQGLHAYMINYINSRRHRRQGPKVNSESLTKVIKFHIISTGPAIISWGIGDIDELNKVAKHWYVLNYGRMVSGAPFIPGGGKKVSGYFSPSGAPDSSKAGGNEPFIHGTGHAMTPKKAIRSIPYIDATRFKLNLEAMRLLQKFGGK